jgi:hypothetical protein
MAERMDLPMQLRAASQTSLLEMTGFEVKLVVYKTI